MKIIRVGARGSKLSIAQANLVVNELKKQGIKATLLKISSRGDIDQHTPLSQMKHVGVFTSSLEQALVDKKIDVAVHSFKDLPTEIDPRTIAHSVLVRNDPRDVLLVFNDFLMERDGKIFLKKGTRIGTSSARRQSQLLFHFKDVTIVDIRGNVETRIRKLEEGWIDALMMAQAPFERMTLSLPSECKKIFLPLKDFPTAPSQGALAVQYRKDDTELESLLERLMDMKTEEQVQLERTFLRSAGKGCQLPMGVSIYQEKNGYLTFSATLAPPNWRRLQEIPLNRYLITAPTLEVMKQHVLNLAQQLGNPNEDQVQERLTNQHVVITRKIAHDPIVDLLIQAGALVTQLDVLQTLWYPPERYLPLLEKEIEDADWIVITSRNAVNALESIFRKNPSRRPGFKVACIGQSSARVIHARNLPVHYVAKGKTSVDLGNELLSLMQKAKSGINDETKPFKVIHLCAQDPTSYLRDLMQKHAVSFIEIPVYETVENASINDELVQLPRDVDVAIVLSSKQAKWLIQHVSPQWAKKWVAIGPRTAKTLKELGINQVIVPPRPTPDGILEVLSS